MGYAHYLVFLACLAVAFSQRSPYAGKNPIGYPTLELTTLADNLGNRFGAASTSTEPLPIEALGDRELFNRLSKLPVDKQPFWLINWRALEEQRKNQLTYEQRPSPFFDDPSWNVNRNQAQFQNFQNNDRNSARF